MTFVDPVPSSFANTEHKYTAVGFPTDKYALALGAVAFVKAFRKQLLAEFEFAGLALTPAEARVLILLGHNEGLSQSHLAHILSCEPMTLVGIVGRRAAADPGLRRGTGVARRV